MPSLRAVSASAESVVQTAAVQTVADQKSLLFIREEKQIMQQQSCPKCIKGVVRRRMRSLIGKLMALPPLLLTQLLRQRQ